MTPRPMEVLLHAAPQAAQGFQAMRAALGKGPLSEQTVELIVIGALAATGQHQSLAVHARRAFELGVGAEEIRHAIVAPLGAATLFSDAVKALETAQEIESGE